MASAARLADLILPNLTRAYPNQISHLMSSDADARPPRALTPIFWGCYDWHSAVHSHWAVARLRRTADSATAARIDAALDAQLVADAAAGEHAYLEARPGFERPYGLAWLVTLAAEVRATRWAAALAPLARLARDRLVAWLGRLPAPIRAGEHAQTAFAASLALDAARATGDAEAAAAIAAFAERHHAADRDAPLPWEPGAHDFLSPALGIAALIARVRAPDAFAAWLDGFAPALGRAPTLAPVRTIDRADGKLVHWDGLNLSRAWMLDAIAGALPPADARAPALRALAADHLAAGLAALDDLTYAGSHWLPTFAVCALTGPVQ